ncbi:MAG: L-threonylcarbamoyladenylate synthase [Candidatus Hermodarchaeota archaeon]
MGFLIKLKGKSIEDLDFVFEIAIENIIEGKLIAFPTDSVYGLGGNPLNLELINRIYEIKYRDRSKGLLLLVADIEEAEKIAVFTRTSYKLAEHFWPGQLTLILKRKEPNLIPPEVTAYKSTIGIRVPENEIVQTLLRKLRSKGYFGGLIATSANYSGEPPSISGDEVAKKFLTPIDLIIDGGKAKSQISTTILDCSSEELKILRLGIVGQDQIDDVIKSVNE